MADLDWWELQVAGCAAVPPSELTASHPASPDAPEGARLARQTSLRADDATRLLGRALVRLTLSPDRRAAWSVLTHRDFLEEESDDIASEGAITFVMEVSGVQMGALLREVRPGEVRVSLRSRCALSVRGIAQRFGGGGHARASGCTLSMPVDEAVAAISQALVDALAERGVA